MNLQFFFDIYLMWTISVSAHTNLKPMKTNTHQVLGL